MSYTNLGYRIYVSGETGAGSVNAPQAMIWDFNSDVSDPLNYTEKLALTTDGGLRINNAYTLPTAAPAGNGYVITGATDGTTAWVANSGGGGGATFWSEGSSNKIYYNSGNVGIGTTDPNYKLDVRGDVNVSGTLYMENGWELDGTSSTNFELDNGGTLKYRFNNGRFQTVHAGTAAAPTLVDNNDTTTGIFYPSTSDWAVSTDGTLALYVGASQGVGLGTQSIDTRQSEGLTISGTNITDTAFTSSTHKKITSLFVPSLGSGSYISAGIGHRNSQVGDGRAEPPVMVIGDIGTSLHNNAMNSGRAVSLVLAGTAGYNSGGQDYGNFGSLLFHGNSNWSGNARRWLLSNAFRNSGAGDMGLGFAGGDSSAGIDPTISGSTPSVVMSTDSNYGVAGKGGLLVGNTTHIDNGKVTIVDSDNNKQLTLAHDGSNYTTFKTDSSGILTISGATTVTYPPFQVLPGGGIRIDRYTRLMRDTTSNGLNVDDGAGNAVPINVRGVMAGDGYVADPDIGEVQMYSSSNSDGDSTGKLTFNSRDSGGTTEQYAFISGTIHDATHTEEAGQLDIGTLVDGTSTPTMTIVSGNVGIGTASPGVALDVQDDTAGTALVSRIYHSEGSDAASSAELRIVGGNASTASLKFGDGAAYRYSLVTDTSDNLLFKATDTNTRMTLDSAGNLGIGTTPTDKLNINTGLGTFDFRDYNLTYTTSLGIRTEAGYLTLATEGANDINLATNGFSNKRLVVKSDGKVGIGTPEPPEKLYVSGGRIGSFETNREILVDPYVAVGGDNQYSGILGQEGLMLATPGDSYLDLWVPDGRYVSFRSATGSTSDNATTYISGTRANSEYIYFKPTGTAYNKSAYVYARNELQLAAASNMSFNAAGSLTIHIDDDLSVYNPGGNSNLTIRQDSTAFYELQADDDFVWKTANTNQKMILTSGGRLGINTTSPGSQLHVSGTGAFNNTDGIRLGNTTHYASLFANNSSGGLEIDSPHSMVLDCGRHMEFHAGGTTREHRYMYATTQYGFMTTADANSYWAIGNKSAAASGLLLSGAAGGIRMVPADGNVTVVGTISATAKSFDIPHPDKEGMRLVHGSLEGPEHGVYARGTAKGHGETTIELPDYWKTLVGDDYTLQLTSYNSSNVYIVDKKEDSFTVDSNALTYKFDYVVIGRREEIEVEQDGN
jgi:hypothetical protein